MNRRRVFGLVAGCLAIPAGCLANPPDPTGPRNPPVEPANDPRQRESRSPLEITDFDFEEGADGGLRVFGTVENRSRAERRAAVRIAVTADERHVRTVEVDVAPQSSAEFAAVFEVRYRKFVKRGDIDIRLV